MNPIILPPVNIIKMDLALNNLQKLICLKTQTIKPNQIEHSHVVPMAQFLRTVKVSGILIQHKYFFSIFIRSHSFAHS